MINDRVYPIFQVYLLPCNDFQERQVQVLKKFQVADGHWVPNIGHCS